MDATKAIMLGGGAGLAALAMLAVPYLPPAVASEEPAKTLLKSASDLWPPAFNPDALMKWDYYVQPGVSLEPIRQSTIRKIGYGRSTFVNVVETESGIYSSDALDSPYIEYPGIVKEPRTARLQQMRVWDGAQWVVTAVVAANSFVAITPLSEGAVVTGSEGNCTVVDDTTYC